MYVGLLFSRCFDIYDVISGVSPFMLQVVFQTFETIANSRGKKDRITRDETDARKSRVEFLEHWRLYMSRMWHSPTRHFYSTSHLKWWRDDNLQLIFSLQRRKSCRSWLKQYAKSRNVVGSVPDDDTRFLNWHIPPSRTVALDRSSL
jgi:hypothetical protein